MGIRSSLARSLFFVILIIVFLGSVKTVNAQEVMPLSEIKPGMKGYGFAVFNGIKPQRFNFEVKGNNLGGLANYLVVLLSGGPKDKSGRRLIELSNIFGGMSGAPLYIDGKIIGALSSSWVNQKIPQVEVTPIESIVGMGRTVLLTPNKLLNVGPSDGSPLFSREKLNGGELYIACDVWDNNNYCTGVIGHITLVDRENPNILYALGHFPTNSNGVSVVGIPFWRGDLVTIIPSSSFSKILVNKTGPMLGSMIFNGRFGQIGELGAVPKSFPVSVILKNNPFGNAKFNYLFAYTANISSHIEQITRNRGSLIDGRLDVEEECFVDVNALGRIYYKSAAEKAIELGSSASVLSTSAGPLVQSLVSNDLNPVINKVDLVLRAVPRYKILKLKEVLSDTRVANEDGHRSYLDLIATGEKEWKTRVIFDNKYRDKPLSIARGKNIATKILFDGLGLDSYSVELLAKISDWNAAYLYYEPDKNASPSVQEKNNHARQSLEMGGWQASSRAKIEILAQIKPPGPEYILEGELNFIINSAQPEKEKNGKN